MARRIHGDILVAPRPNGGAVVTLKSATGEAIEIERTPIKSQRCSPSSLRSNPQSGQRKKRAR
jgi:hypothetical protein